MEKIIEFLKDNNVDYLKFGEAEFLKKENLLSLTFLYEDINKELLQQNQNNIEELIKKYVNLDVKYSIKYKKAFLDENRLNLKIKDFLQKKFIACFYALKDLKVKQNDNQFVIDTYFSLSETEIDKINNEIINYLQNKFFYIFIINGHSVNEVFNELEQHKNAILDNLVNPIKLNKIKVNKIQNILGEINEFSCYPYEYYTNAEENVILCGHLVKIEKIEFTKKDGETKGIRYALTVKSLDNYFKASIFPSKKNLDICDTIENDSDIIMQGNLDSFNNELTMKVKNLAKCEIESYEKPKHEINREYKNYRYVFPQKYEEISQLNLFEEQVHKDYLLNNEFVVFDFETTGLEYMVDKVTEIGAVKIKNGKIEETFSCLINPKKHISKEITEKTGIDDKMVKDAPLFEDVLPDFYKFCKNCILVGQNVDFDFGFLDYYGRKANYIFDNKKEDTLILARKYLFLKNYKLKTIAENLKVSLINAHRALNDALATAKVFIKIIEKFY